jgi:dienelactone hydrolase
VRREALIAFATVALAAVAWAGPATRAGLAGHWDGEWRQGAAVLPVSMHFSRASATELAGSFDSDALRVTGIPLRKITESAASVSWEIPGDFSTSKFAGTVNGDVLDGTFEDGGKSGTFHLTRSASAAAEVTEETLAFESGGLRLEGTLVRPAAAGPFPVVVFLHGSGPEGRWASKYLATRLAKRGVAGFIRDKRGVGASQGDWRTAGFDDLIADGVAAIAALRRHPKIDARRIGVYGHSQGAAYLPSVAEGAPDVAFLIGSAATGVPMDELEEYSLGNIVGVSKLEAPEAAKAKAYVKAVVDTAYRGAPRAAASDAHEAVKDRPWAFPIPEAGDPYWTLAPKFAAYDPLAHWKSVRVPVLLLFGEKDERVPARRSAASLTAVLSTHQANDVTVRIFPDADHNLRTPSGPEDPWPGSAAGFPGALLDWVERVVREKR